MAMKLMPYGLIDPPNRYTDSLETWERHLAWAEPLADDDVLKEMTVEQARRTVARKRREKQAAANRSS